MTEEEKKPKTLRDIAIEGYKKALAEAENCSEYLEWKNNLSLAERTKLYFLTSLYVPTTKEIMDNYERIIEKALNISSDGENKRKLTELKNWFDKIKNKYGKKKEIPEN